MNALIPSTLPNQAIRPAGSYQMSTDASYDLLGIEFDDQGRPYHLTAVGLIMDHLERVMESSDAFICIFVHGWKHNASDHDDNVESFRRLLHANAHVETLRPKTPRSRRVIGIYVAWRGLSFQWLHLAENLTFWSRKEAALRVALGSVRELFARLRRLRLARPPRGDEPGTTLVLAGHSFGGLILYSAVAEYLIESVAVPSGPVAAVDAFGDLVILINPAFEAARYHPLHDIVFRRGFLAGQAPVLLSVTATNDWATRYAFPLGRHFGWSGRSINQREQDANYNTMGHVPWMATHDLGLMDPKANHAKVRLIDMPNLQAAERFSLIQREDDDFARAHAARIAASRSGGDAPIERDYSAGARLTRRSSARPGSADNPFWVVQATPEIVNGHNGIFGYVFLDFLRQVIDDRIRSQTPGHAR